MREELGEIINERILADGKLLVFCRSAAQMAKAVMLKAIGERRVEGFVPERKTGSKGVILEFHWKCS